MCKAQHCGWVGVSQPLLQLCVRALDHEISKWAMLRFPRSCYCVEKSNTVGTEENVLYMRCPN